MSHSYNRLLIHAIWGTKDRLPLIIPKSEQQIIDFIKSQFSELGCQVIIMNGTADHIHCLFLLNAQKAITEIIKQVKGSSSHFINENNLTYEKFSWQTGYAAYSVSESVLEKVYEYISNQKTHHLKKTFQEEYESFIALIEKGNG